MIRARGTRTGATRTGAWHSDGRVALGLARCAWTRCPGLTRCSHRPVPLSPHPPQRLWADGSTGAARRRAAQRHMARAPARHAGPARPLGGRQPGPVARVPAPDCRALRTGPADRRRRLGGRRGAPTSGWFSTPRACGLVTASASSAPTIPARGGSGIRARITRRWTKLDVKHRQLRSSSCASWTRRMRPVRTRARACHPPRDQGDEA